MNRGLSVRLIRLQDRGGKVRAIRRVREVLALETKGRILFEAAVLWFSGQLIARVKLNAGLGREDFKDPPRVGIFHASSDLFERLAARVEHITQVVALHAASVDLL